MDIKTLIKSQPYVVTTKFKMMSLPKPPLLADGLSHNERFKDSLVRYAYSIAVPPSLVYILGFSCDRVSKLLFPNSFPRFAVEEIQARRKRAKIWISELQVLCFTFQFSLRHFWLKSDTDVEWWVRRK